MTTAISEGFSLDGLGRVLRTVGHTAQQALPGAIQGAAAGAAVGGPPGAVIGGLAGGVLSASSAQHASAAPSSSPTVAAAPTSTMSTSTGAAQLAQLLSNPQLLALLHGMTTRPGMPSPGDVPPGALLNLVGVLANQAAVEAEEQGWTGDDHYLRDRTGAYLCDPLDARSRAARVNALLVPPAESTERSAIEWLRAAGWVWR